MRALRRSLLLHRSSAAAWVTAVAAMFSIALGLGHRAEAGRPISRTLVFLDGVATPVQFNDGDSFRALDGPYRGMGTRLEGFNTLESHGPVHRFGTWTSNELFVLAKMATTNAQNGIWHCHSSLVDDRDRSAREGLAANTSTATPLGSGPTVEDDSESEVASGAEGDLETDTYGRVLWLCEDLAVDQIRKGLAHAMSINEKPAHAKFLAAQQEAIALRRGMWAHGVPAYLVTSLHSSEEDWPSRTYNRLVSTADGHSAGWKHEESYDECAEVCSRERAVDPEVLMSVRRAIADDSLIASTAASLGEELLLRVIRDFAALGFATDLRDRPEVSSALDSWLREHAEPRFAAAPYVTGSCAVYVRFDRRYVDNQPRCLR